MFLSRLNRSVVARAATQASATFRRNTPARFFSTIKVGDRVEGLIEIRDADSDTMIVTSKENGPGSLQVGVGSLLPGLETALVGMKVGDRFDKILKPEEAFGEPNPDFVQVVKLREEDVGSYKVGDSVHSDNPQMPQQGVITEVEGDQVVVDWNHPYAGKNIHVVIDIENVEEEDVNAWSGVRVERLSAGDGETYPKAGDKVTVSYRGTLASNGKQFDANSTFTFTLGVGQVISGWDIGVSKLSLGESAKLFVPSEFAYGEAGAGGVIPPNAHLIFDVQLLKIGE